MKYWKTLSHEQINERVKKALAANVDFQEAELLGVPASNLDTKVFYHDAPFLKDAPFLNALVKNPNHIGCHTLGNSESFFAGTHEIERELINICATDILKAEPESCDGYVAAGGTEANIQAIWTYRNFFRNKFNAQQDEICIITSEDAHYSMPKAADILNLDIVLIPVHNSTRSLDREVIRSEVKAAMANGKKYFIAVSNMMTTMFGSVDDPQDYIAVFNDLQATFKLHVDGAYGGFLHPFMNQNTNVCFQDSNISSVTLDAHKLVQAPYGTGILIIRKGLMENVYTRSAQYVKGMDVTLSGSRSGANPIAVWMILSTYGPHGWYEKNQLLLMRTNMLCNHLKELNVEYYRNQYSNIVTIRSKYISEALANRFGLVPDTHDSTPNWFKIVVMDHVSVDKLENFIDALEQSLM